MRCYTYDCINNDGGCCCCPDYVVIENGKCTEYWEPIRDGEPDE